MRFASWNVNNRSLRQSHVDFLQNLRLDVLALQEVSLGFHGALVDSGLFAWGRTSLTLRPTEAGETAARKLGCSVFGSGGLRPDITTVLSGVAFPERTLMVNAQSAAGVVLLCSFHIPPGASWKEIKPQTMCAIADRLAKLPGTAIVGMDANAPKQDHPEHCDNVWWWPDEPKLLGHEPGHHLRDALRTYLARHPGELEDIRQARPYGPLALSHRRGVGKTRTDCRYDFILCTPDVEVAGVQYLYEESVAAGSDHALVVAELELHANETTSIR
ncbi:MAG: endonuclease/exonuclease/phosphatase family protein [Candidatus Sumerlaeaceae bacterium]